MIKKLTDSESLQQQNSVKYKWQGDLLNNSDIGYDDDWFEIN
jgi:hypothetical protein